MKQRRTIGIWVAVNSDVNSNGNSKIKEKDSFLGITPRLPKYYTLKKFASHKP